MSTYHNELSTKLNILISQEELVSRLKDLGQEITRDYADRELVLVGVLHGAFIFLSDLCRQIHLPLRCDFVELAAYGSRTEASGVVRFTSDLTRPIKDLDVLVVEDIIDTGLTLHYLLNNLKTRMPRSLAVCSLLYKPEASIVPVDIKYLGFTIPNEFVVGYGMDQEGHYRNLPYIGVLNGIKAE